MGHVNHNPIHELIFLPLVINSLLLQELPHLGHLQAVDLPPHHGCLHFPDYPAVSRFFLDFRLDFFVFLAPHLALFLRLLFLDFLLGASTAFGCFLQARLRP